MIPNEFVETLTFQKNDSSNELRQDVNWHVHYQDRKTKYWISWWVGFFCLITSEMYLQEALKTTDRTNKKPEPHNEFICVRIVKSLPSKQGNGQRTQMSWFSSSLTPKPGILFVTKFPCASPEFLQHSASSHMPTLARLTLTVEELTKRWVNYYQQKAFFF